MFTKLIACALLLFLGSKVQCARILGIFNIPSISHQVVYQPIWKELSLRGHEVIVISPDPLNDPTLTNLTEIDMSSLYGIIQEMSPDMSNGMDHWTFLENSHEWSNRITTRIFSHPEVQALLKNDTKGFDLVMIETIFYSSAMFAAKYKCPLIGVSSLDVPITVHETVGNPIHPVLYPDFLTVYREEKTLFQKLDLVIYYFWQNYLSGIRRSFTNEETRKYIGEGLPDIDEVVRNMSMLFLNTNPILHRPRPYGPNVVELGGRMHLKPRKPLPKELKEYLDNSTRGVIYFSLGSNVKSIHLDRDKRKILIDTFSELPYDVLWKFEDEELENKPANVRISKWLPQQDLLGHPNIKLFISQGGLQSTGESLMNGVPMLIMPFIADQFLNAEQIEKLGAGLHLDFKSLTKKAFKTSVLEITENQRYKQRAREVGRLLEDEEKTGLEKAVWWTEYVIRNKGAHHLRSRATGVSWFEFFLVDVVAFVLCTIVLALYVIYKILRYASNSFWNTHKVKTS